MRIKIQAHCSDSFGMIAKEGDTRTLDYQGYVPSFLGGGDDVELTIDVETGQIIGWDKDAALAEINELKEE